MKKLRFVLVSLLLILFVGCSTKKEDNTSSNSTKIEEKASSESSENNSTNVKTSLDTNKIVVAEDGSFEVTGTAEKGSYFYLNDETLPDNAIQSKGDKFTFKGTMALTTNEANFKVKDLDDNVLLDETLTFDTSKYKSTYEEDSE